MRKALSGSIATALLTATLAGATSIVPPAALGASMAEQGKKIAFDRRKGNCMSCHVIAGANLHGNIGPPLLAMKQRFPDKAALRAQIWDSTVKNPQSMMPPFGKHRVLSEDEIDKVIEYLLTL